MNVTENKMARWSRFADDAVMNALTLAGVTALEIYYVWGYSSVSLAVLALAFISMVGYTLWFFIKRPENTVVSKPLSWISTLSFFFYFVTLFCGIRGDWMAWISIALAASGAASLLFIRK